MKFIVGIDPGTTSAIAILSLDAAFSCVYSKKNLTLSKICEYIADKGEPIIVATDVSRPPMLVKKVAAAFNAALFSPKKNIPQTKKRRLAKSAKLKNKHEKDALAAAVNARKAFLNMFEKIDSILKKKQMTEVNEDVKSLLIKHDICNIQQAIKVLKEEV